MSPTVKTAGILTGLVLLLVVSTLWAWSAVTSPMPQFAELPPCADRSVEAGEQVKPGDVVVSVLNAGTREGLAGRTMQQFTDSGFGEGDRGNAPAGSGVTVAQIWASDPTNPAVQLVLGWLGPDTEVVDRAATQVGVVVVVGDEFDSLASGPPYVTAAGTSTICSPPA